MNTRTILDTIAHPPRMTDYQRAELSDYGLNTLRETCREHGYDLRAVIAENLALVNEHRLSLDADGMRAFFRVKRAGRGMCRLDRRTKAAFFAHLVAIKGGRPNVRW